MTTNKAGDIVSKGMATCGRCGRAYENTDYTRCPHCADKARRAAVQGYADAIIAKTIARHREQAAR